MVHPHVSFACAGKMKKKRQILCVCGCFKWLWLSWKLSLTILSPSTCEEWISAEWQITVCLPYCPHHMRHAGAYTAAHGCVTHLTPVIIAFRPVTGRISIHSGWDLFFGGVGWLVVEVGSSNKIDGTCLDQKENKRMYIYIQLQILSIKMFCRWTALEHRQFFVFVFSCCHASVAGFSLSCKLKLTVVIGVPR